MVIDADGGELVDALEIADRLGFKGSRQVLDLRCHRLGFPEPVGRTGRRLIWSWAQVETWAQVGAATALVTLVAAGAS